MSALLLVAVSVLGCMMRTTLLMCSPCVDAFIENGAKVLMVRWRDNAVCTYTYIGLHKHA